MNIIIKILVVVIIGVATNKVGYSTVPTATIFNKSVDLRTVEMEEIWKDVIGYEGLYRVSSLGLIKGLDRIVPDKRKGTVIVHGKIMTQNINNRGYYTLSLCKNSTYKHCVVHKLVAESFVDNPNNYQYVNHIDGNKLNNNYLNLEWVTMAQNNQHAYDMGLKKGAATGLFGKNNKSSKPLFQIDKNTHNILREFECVHEVYRILGFPVTNIACACRGKVMSSFGFEWKYKT